MNTVGSQVLNVPIEDIIPNRFQPRLNFDEQALQELASSIKIHGIIQPLVLRRLGDKYEIIAGERRYKAAKMVGLTSVPAIISSMNDQESAEVAIIENVQRQNLSAIEEAKSFKSLLDKGYLTQEELAKRMGLSQSAVSNKMRLLTLSNNVQNALIEGKISERHARSLLQLKDHQEQDEWLKKVIEERLTVRLLDTKLKDYLGNLEVNNIIEKIEPTPSVIIQEQINIDNKGSDTQMDNYMTNNKPMPNKFFNFLEDEAVNMNISETPNEVITPADEEIEMLDFELSPINNTNEVVVNNDPFDEARSIIEKAIVELNNKYIVVFETDENNGLKYTINIDKKEM